MTATKEAATKGQHEMVLTRTFDAPRALVFQAWMDPQHLAQWWGPRGFTNPVCEFDARPGGAILIHMSGPDGTVFPMTGTVHEVAAPERLVFTSRAMEDEAGNALLEVHNTVTFVEREGKTTVTVRAVVLKVAPEMAGALAGMNEGWAQSLDKLSESLGGTDTSEREIVVTRTFDAPRELVFDAFTDPKHMAKWWGPNGFTTTTQEMDVRPGGVWRFVMHGPDGRDYKNRIVYVTVARPDCLAYKHAGEEGEEDVNFFTTVTFVDRGGKTEVTMRAAFPTKEARDEVVEKYGALEGAHQNLARLGEHLAGTIDRVVINSRVFDARRDCVFAAFSDPVQLAKWWGPKDFANSIHEFDLRPSGKWRLTMHGPDGTDYPNESVFTEVVKPERVVFQHLEPVHKFQMTLTFAEEGGKTRVMWRMVFESAEEYAKVKAFMAGANEQNFDRLAAHLANSSAAPAAEEFVLTRTFDAPRDLVFKAWTEAERLAKWWGPKGFTMLACKLDLRPGGVFHYGMKAPNGGEMWGKWVFREVSPPKQLVFVASFSDAQCATTRAPFSADWPLEVLSTVTFTENAGKTTITMRAVPVNVTAAESAFFTSMHKSMTGGWGGTLDQLAAFLAQG